MDIANINATIASMMQLPQTAILAGMIAAFTPCTLAIIPILLYRFGVWNPAEVNKHKSAAKWRQTFQELGLLWLGYLGSFLILGWFLSGLFGSDLVNISRLVLGILMVFVGVLQIGGQISFDFIRNNTNPFVTGVTLPLIVSFSPCVLPVISPLVASAGTDGSSVFRFLLFGIGILIPAVLLALGGRKLLELFKKSSRVIAQIEKFSAVLIIGSGVYLAAQLVRITPGDLAIASLILIGLIVVTTYSVLVKQKLKTVRNVGWSILLVFGGIIVSLVAQTRVLALEPVRGQEFVYACSTMDKFVTEEALLIALLFCGTSFATGWFYLTRYREGRKLKLRFT